jgi:hypothetical protein
MRTCNFLISCPFLLLRGILERPAFEDPEPTYPVKDLPTPDPAKDMFFREMPLPADTEQTPIAISPAIEAR